MFIENWYRRRCQWINVCRFLARLQQFIAGMALHMAIVARIFDICWQTQRHPINVLGKQTKCVHGAHL